MATVTKTIGTSSRNYSTINAWEADLNDGDIYSNGDTAIGEMYADSTFTGATSTIENGSDIGGSAAADLALIKLTVHADSRHDGTAESGALLKPTANSGHDVGIIRINVDNVTVEWLDISLDSLDSADTNKAIVLTGTNNNCIIRNNLIHDKGGNPGSSGPFMIHTIAAGGGSDTTSILNNIIYNIVETGADTAGAINMNQWQGTINIYNNTVYNIDSNGSNKAAYAYRYNGHSGQTANVKNNIAAKMVADTASYKRAFWDTGTGTANEDYNLSDDTISTSTYEATGSNSLTDKTLAEISFVSTGVGTEDLHIDSDSDCVDAGVDLGTTNGVNIDINQRDRDAAGDTWDIGAHELVPEATAGAAFLLFLD
jgi:hypothetical protein